MSNIVVLGTGMAGFGASHQLQRRRRCGPSSTRSRRTSAGIRRRSSTTRVFCSTSARTSPSRRTQRIQDLFAKHRRREVRGRAGQARQLSGAACA